MTRMQEVAELNALASKDIEVKHMIQTVCAAENTNIVSLAEDQPEVFEMLYEECYAMVGQLGEDIE